MRAGFIGAAALDLRKSKELLARASAVDATMADPRYVWLVDGEYPLYGERGRGARIRDVDGNDYLDFFLGSGTVVLGHADPEVSAAVSREIADGFAITVRKTVQVRLAELLTEVIPGAERVLMLKTGSEATSAAVRLSRAVTGRDRVIRWGYNGWHDWCASSPGGIPSCARDLVDTFAYNDPAALDRAFRQHPGDVACLLMMPFELDPPQDGFLEEARRIAHRHGALFVLDEVRSGFRVALGGAQQRYGVRSDLAVFSKALANGYPISVVTGSAEILGRLREVHIGSTYANNGAEMAAAVATVTRLRDTTALADIETLGSLLQAGLRAQIDRSGLPCVVTGVPQMPFLRFTARDIKVRTRMIRAFYTETIRLGVLLHPYHHWYVCAAMTADDIDEALDATAAGFAAAA
jgi:glutamate-1-semialdehyde aminotransferase